MEMERKWKDRKREINKETNKEKSKQRNEEEQVKKGSKNEIMKYKLFTEQHQATFNPGEMRDYIDVYLSEIDSETDPESSFFKEKGIENLIQALSDLFFAGSETTRLFLFKMTFFQR